MDDRSDKKLAAAVLTQAVADYQKDIGRARYFEGREDGQR